MVETKQDPKVGIILVLIDGIADYQHKDIGLQTPLQAANIPYMNAIAKSGICGLHDPVQSGLACGSDTAHMQLFGYNPIKLYNGRGAFETMGAGVDMSFDDIAFKCNFAYINDETNVVERRRVDREFHWGVSLCDDLNDLKIPGFEDYIVKCEYATEHRCGIKVTGKNLSSQITGTDPLKDFKKLLDCRPIDEEDQAAVLTAKLVNALSDQIRKILGNHPINLNRKEKGLPYTNLILLRGCGQRLGVPTFQEIHGLRPFMLAPTCIIRGTGITFGIPIFEVDGATGFYDSNLDNKARKAVEKLLSDDFDFGFLHVKAIDDAGHDKNLGIKVSQLEKCDKAIKILVDSLSAASDASHQYIICVTGDHTTPIIYGDHTYEPVCIAMSLASNVAAEIQGKSQDSKLSQIRDQVQRFNEIDCASGKSALGRYSSKDTMGVLKNLRTLVTKMLSQQ